MGTQPTRSQRNTCSRRCAAPRKVRKRGHTTSRVPWQLSATTSRSVISTRSSTTSTGATSTFPRWISSGDDAARFRALFGRNRNVRASDTGHKPRLSWDDAEFGLTLARGHTRYKRTSALRTCSAPSSVHLACPRTAEAGNPLRHLCKWHESGTTPPVKAFDFSHRRS